MSSVSTSNRQPSRKPELPLIRIFVSSPGEVGEERRAAGRILNRFVDQYKTVCQIEGYFWEYAKITAHYDFQSQIPEMDEFDVCMCILWARMGSPPGKFRPDGTPYQSGTQYEVEQSISSFARQGRPLLFVYRRLTEPILDLGEESKSREAREQHEKLRRFFQEHFDGGDAQRRRATHGYASLAEFEEKFSQHLQKIISERLATERQAEVRWDRGSPFRGLSPFDREHSSVFFGREADTHRIVDQLCQQATDRNAAFVLLLGPSGCGKSSLAQAGVLPRLLAGGSGRNAGEFRVAIVRPGSGAVDPDPLASLAAGLQDSHALPDISSDVLMRLRQAPANAQQFVIEALKEFDNLRLPSSDPAADTKLLLIVDQLEELFTRRETTVEQRRDFARALLSLKESGSTWIVATLRQDFYAEFCQVPELAELKGADGQYDLLPPRAAEIEQIIAEPARAAGLEYERLSEDEDLYEILRHTAMQQPESLPLLEFSLQRLYEKMQERLAAKGAAEGRLLLKIEDYREAGGLEGIVASQAENAYQSVSEETRNSDALRRLLRMLVHVSADGGTVSRQAAARLEIAADPRLAELAESFVQARLLTVQDTSFELTHEAVLQHWRRSREWLSLERPLLQARSRLQSLYFEEYRNAVREKTRIDKRLLPRGLPLQAAMGVQKAGLLDGGRFAEIREYVARSRRFHRNRLLRSVAIGCLLAGVFLAIAVSLYVTYRGATIARLARVRLLQDASVEHHRAGDDGISAVLLGMALNEASGLDAHLEKGLRMAISLADARILPLQVLKRAEGEVLRCCAISADGNVAGIGTDSGRLYCVDLAQGDFIPLASDDAVPFQQIVIGDRIEAIASNPAKRAAFAVATAKGYIRYVDLDCPPTETVREWQYQGRPRCVAFSPNGRDLIVAGKPRNSAAGPVGLVLYQLTDPQAAPRTFAVDYELYAAAISGDGQRLVAGGGIPPDPRLSVWDLNAAPQTPPRIIDAPSRVFSLDCRPGFAHQFVTGDVNGMVYEWDLSRQPGSEFTGRSLSYGKQVRLTTFSEDGRFLLIGGESKLARVWDVEGWSPMGQPFLHRDQARSGAIFSSTGRIITAEFSGDFRIWHLSPRVAGEAIFRHSSAITAASFSESGKEIAVGFPSGTAGPGGGVVWELGTRRRIELPHGSDVMAVRFRPSHPGEVITCGVDGKVVLWNDRRAHFVDAPLGRREVAERQCEFDYGELVYAASFHPSGDRLIYAGFGNGIHVHDFDRRRNAWTLNSIVKETDVRTYIWGLRFDSNGDRFYSDAGSSVRGWRLAGDYVDSIELQHPSLFPSDQQDDAAGAEPAGKGRGKTLPEGVLADLSPTSDRAIVRWTDGRMAVFDLDAAEPKPRLLGSYPHGRARGTADWCRRENLIATGGADGTAMVWREHQGDWRPLKKNGQEVVFRHPSPVAQLEMSPDGNWLATSCEDGAVRIWSVDEGLWSGVGWYHAGPVTALQFSPDGQAVLSAGRDGTLKVVSLPVPISGSAASILNRLKADAGIEMQFSREGASATYGVPHAITVPEFQRCRELEATEK